MTLDRALLKKGFFILIILAVAPFAFEVVLLPMSPGLSLRSSF
jgi:hypothetical protein